MHIWSFCKQHKIYLLFTTKWFCNYKEKKTQWRNDAEEINFVVVTKLSFYFVSVLSVIWITRYACRGVSGSEKTALIIHCGIYFQAQADWTSWNRKLRRYEHDIPEEHPDYFYSVWIVIIWNRLMCFVVNLGRSVDAP